MTCSLRALATISFFAGCLVASGSQPPNIVFILADDLGWRDTGFSGAEVYRTPHLDRMAKEGMVFPNAYSSGPNCAPTRASFVTGLYTPRHQIWTPGGASKGKPSHMALLVPAREREDKKLEKTARALVPSTNRLADTFVTIPEILSQKGYVSARLGKWHLGPDLHGFDISSSNGLDGPHESHYGSVTVAEDLTKASIDFIRENKNRPFFLYLSHWDPHVPHRGTEEELARWEAIRDTLAPDKRSELNPAYATMIERLDNSVGQILEEIDRQGLAENTLIVFTSDNGGVSGASEIAPLRSMKGSLFEGGIRVPLCVRWTGVVPAGSQDDTPVNTVDFLPTFAEVTGAELPADIPFDGISLMPLLKGDSIEDRALFWHFPLYLTGPGLKVPLQNKESAQWRGFPSTAMRQGKWKALHFFEQDTLELFDLEQDPGETTDLAAEYPEVAARMKKAIQSWQKSADAPVPDQTNPEFIGFQ